MHRSEKCNTQPPPVKDVLADITKSSSSKYNVTVIIQAGGIRVDPRKYNALGPWCVIRRTGQTERTRIIYLHVRSVLRVRYM